MIVIGQSSEEGAQTSIHLAVADEVATTTGEYFSDCKVSIKFLSLREHC